LRREAEKADSLPVRRAQMLAALIVTCSATMARAVCEIGPECVLFGAVYFGRGSDVIDSSNELTLEVGRDPSSTNLNGRL